MSEHMPQLPPVKVSVENTKPIVCECGNDTFQEAFFMRIISKLLTGTPEDALYPIATMVCTKCGAVPKQFQLKMPEKPKESPILQTP